MAGKAPSAPQQGGHAGAMAPRPFITGSREIESHTYDKTVTMTAGGGQPFDTYDFVTDGYVSGCYINVVATVPSDNSAAVAYTEDGPWNALLNVQFSDVSNRPIIGPMSGWELKECIKYGGYTQSADPADSQTFSAVTGTGATGGNFSFTLHLPIEFVHRNAMGSLTNLSNAAVFRLDFTLNGGTSIYSTSPTALPAVRIRLQQHGWMESAGRDPFGNPAAPTPPAVDTVQYWERQTYSLSAAAQNFRFTPFEGHVRNVIFVLRGGTAATARADGQTNWPDPLRLHYDATIPIDRLKNTWQRYVEELWGYTAALGSNPVNGKENGVFPLAFNRDFANKPGAEQGYGYLYVSAGTAIRFDGTIGGSGTQTLTVLWNYVNPAGGNPLALTGGK